MCTAESAEIESSLFQPLSLLGIVKRSNKRGIGIISMKSNVIVIACVMVMRSLLKKAGLWKRSIEYHVLRNVGGDVGGDVQELSRKRDAEKQEERNPLVAEETEGVEANALSPDEKVKSTVDFVFQRKKK
mgnify:FL=1